MNYCVVCGGVLRETTRIAEHGSYGTGEYHCTECGLKYEFVPPEHLQRLPLPHNSQEEEAI